MPRYLTRQGNSILCCPRVKLRVLFFSVCCTWLVLVFSNHQFHSILLQRGLRTDGLANSLIRGSINFNRGVSTATGVELVPDGNGTRPLPWCPDVPVVTDKQFHLDLNETTYEKLVAKFGDSMKTGGHYAPSTCRSREHLAIIIPYRDRQRNLHILLHNLLPFLSLQLVEFTVFLAEQTEEYQFNKGVLFNAAYKESEKYGQFSCYIMQDTDLVPMDNRNFYRCGKNPRHLCLTTGRTEWKNKVPYKLSFGGAIALRKQHLEEANGFSVSYYGWGLEDDDLALRLNRIRYKLERYAIPIGKYYQLDHKRMPPNHHWDELKRTLRTRQKVEGLNTLNYTLVHHERKELYTRLLIRPPPPPFRIYGNDTARPQLTD